MILARLSAFAASDKIISAIRHRHKPMFHGNLEVTDQALMRTIAYLASTIALIYCHKNEKHFTQPEASQLTRTAKILSFASPEPLASCSDSLPAIGVARDSIAAFLSGRRALQSMDAWTTTV